MIFILSKINQITVQILVKTKSINKLIGKWCKVERKLFLVLTVYTISKICTTIINIYYFVPRSYFIVYFINSHIILSR